MIFSRKIRKVIFYIFILLSGLISGYLIVNLPQWLKPAYTEGDYSKYFGNTKTKIIFYGTSQCPYCAMTKSFFTERKIIFSDFDIEKSEKAKREFNQLGGTSVPLIIIGNRRIDGFNQPAIEAALEKLN